MQYVSLVFSCAFIRIQPSCVFSLGFLPLSMYLQRVCSTVPYHTLLLPLAGSLFAKHREPACPWCWFRGGVGRCMDAAEREPGSSADHKAFTQQIYKLPLIIIIPICLLLRLCHSTVHLRLYSNQRKHTGGGLTGVQTAFCRHKLFLFFCFAGITF